MQSPYKKLRILWISIARLTAKYKVPTSVEIIIFLRRWPMERLRVFTDPEDMTPEERLDRIVELLAIASIRLAQKENLNVDSDKQSPETVDDVKPPIQEHFIPNKPGRVPFGVEKKDVGRIINQREQKFISRIYELSIGGQSTEKIATELNREDHESKWAGKWNKVTVWRILKRIEIESVTK
jgi:hypothetical protein